MSALKINEVVHGSRDISTVYAYYSEAELKNNPQYYGNGQQIKCNYFSCFSGTYKRGKEREFIESIASDKYSHYLISWEDCN